jgi:uncharacterized protein
MKFFSRGTRAGDGQKLRIFFCSDVHGSNVCFRKFLNAGRFYGADVLILGGDITGKQLIPLKLASGGSVSGEMAGERLEAGDPAEVEAVLERLADAGHYGVVCDEDELEALRTNAQLRAEVFERELLGRLQSWIALADERLAGSGIRCLIQGGNDDYDACNEIIAGAEYVELCEDRVLRLDDAHEVISCGRANMTPWACPRDVPEEELAALITAMAERLQSPETAIFNFHCPPADTPLDEAPALGSDLKPRIGPGGLEMKHVGSTAVRSAIERYAPLLSLHGHIHECKGTVRIGRTTCVNPGSDYGEGVLQGALIELAGSQVRGVSLMAG